MRSQVSKNSWFLLIVVALAGLSGYLFTQRELNKGLDVVGGIRFTYQMEELTPEQQERSAEIRDNLQRILAQRVGAALGVVEGNVQAKGTDQFIVELPAFTDEDLARQTLATTAKIQVFHARNVNTELATFRRYSVAGEDQLAGAPVVLFARRSGEQILRPGDPEYETMIEGWDLILEGTEVVDAYPAMVGTGAQPHFRFSASGARSMEEFSRRFLNRREHIAFVLDGKVLSIAPVKDNTILSDNAVIDGTFDPQYVTILTNLVRAGGLPVDLREISSEKVDPTIGHGAFNDMIRAGAISVGFIALFLTAYYAFPGLIAFLALLLYILVTLTVMKWVNATFSLAALAAFVLSIGMAVDANVLVFERIKEEIKRGRTLVTSIEMGFKRALSAIIDSNACTIITSVILFYLGTVQVKGFATTLIIGVVLAFFTAIVVTRGLLMGAITFIPATNNPKWYAVDRSWFGERLEMTANAKPLNIIGRTKMFFGLSALLIIPGMLAIGTGGIRPNVEFQGGYEGGFLLPDATLSLADIRQRLEQADFQGTNVKFATTDELDEQGRPTGDALRFVFISVPNSTLKAMGFQIEGEFINGAEPEAEAEAGTATGSGAEAAEGTEAGGSEQVAGTGSGNSPVAEAETAGNPDSPLKNPVTNQIRDKIIEVVGLPPGSARSSNSIGPTIQREVINNAILAVLFSTTLIVSYLAIRFGFALGGIPQGLRFGLSTVGALIHDVVFILGFAAIVGHIFGWEISALFITSVLTVIGFSTHDTIVIFDRIRENLRRPLKGEAFDNLVNRSITQSVARSINTAFAVVGTLIVLLFIGTPTPDLKFMMATMLFGILIGTYSSIFNASPILAMWNRMLIRRGGEQAGMIEEAVRDAKARAAAAVQTETDSRAYSDPSGKTYSQIKRRESATERSKKELDEDER